VNITVSDMLKTADIGLASIWFKTKFAQHR